MMQAYLDGKREANNVGFFVAALTLALAIVGFLIALRVGFGWMPLGERANILRSNINTIENIVIIAAAIFTLCCARTGFGLFQREQSSLRWHSGCFLSPS